MSDTRELELQILSMQTRLDRCEFELELIRNPPPQEWMTPTETEIYSKGKYRAIGIKRAIDLARKRPEDSPLQLDVHYTIDIGDGRNAYRINYPQFDRAMVEMARFA